VGGLSRSVAGRSPSSTPSRCLVRARRPLGGVAYVGYDAFTKNPEMTVMKWGWVLVRLYTGPIGLAFDVLSCKEPAPGTHEHFVKSGRRRTTTCRSAPRTWTARSCRPAWPTAEISPQRRSATLPPSTRATSTSRRRAGLGPRRSPPATEAGLRREGLRPDRVVIKWNILPDEQLMAYAINRQGGGLTGIIDMRP
jgi:hypothetical protein